VNECSVEREQEMKTFLSIGAGPGMGFATAERFAKEGFHFGRSKYRQDAGAGRKVGVKGIQG
jgi:NAD(P)-dependent dehydrogenase (short-subunit alcohol dehydrogenase family)